MRLRTLGGLSVDLVSASDGAATRRRPLALLDRGETEKAVELYKGPFLDGVFVKDRRSSNAGRSENVTDCIGFA